MVLGNYVLVTNYLGGISMIIVVTEVKNENEELIGYNIQRVDEESGDVENIRRNDFSAEDISELMNTLIVGFFEENTDTDSVNIDVEKLDSLVGSVADKCNVFEDIFYDYNTDSAGDFVYLLLNEDRTNGADDNSDLYSQDDIVSLKSKITTAVLCVLLENTGVVMVD